MRPAWKVQLPKGVKAVGGIEQHREAMLSARNQGIQGWGGTVPVTIHNNETISNQL